MICGTDTDPILLLTSGKVGYFNPEYRDPNRDAQYGDESGEWFSVEGGHVGVRGAKTKTIYLWTWDVKDERPKWVGWLKSTDAIRLDEMKAFARTSQHGLILVTERNTGMIPATIEPLSIEPYSRVVSKRKVRHG